MDGMEKQWFKGLPKNGQFFTLPNAQYIPPSRKFKIIEIGKVNTESALGEHVRAKVLVMNGRLEGLPAHVIFHRDLKVNIIAE